MTAPWQQFGAWTVTRVDETGRRATCRCVCGTEREISVEALQAGESRSCGAWLVWQVRPPKPQRETWRKPRWKKEIRDG